MKRRDFVKISGIAGAFMLSGLGLNAMKPFRIRQAQPLDFSSYKGFNLLAKFSGREPDKKFNEEDFEIMAEWGFNFARIPMSYWNWASIDDWYDIDESVLKDIDEVVEFGKQYNVHINLNMHRVHGYCINNREKEPVD
ncbi:MAG: cellulase family glycosylhydrolase, partial [Bacteroidales bacterium]